MWMFASLLKREKKAFEIAKVNSRCFHSFPDAILVSLRGTPSWHVHVYNFEWYILPNNSSTGYRTALRLWDFVYLLLLYNISISWLNLLNDWWFYFLTCVTCTWLKTKNSKIRLRFIFKARFITNSQEEGGQYMLAFQTNLWAQLWVWRSNQHLCNFSVKLFNLYSSRIF